jgi:hypothetical protein
MDIDPLSNESLAKIVFHFIGFLLIPVIVSLLFRRLLI